MQFRFLLLLLCILSSISLRAQEVAEKIYYPSLKVWYDEEEPIILNLDGKMYNRPSKSIQIDKMTSGKHMLTVYRVRYKKNGKKKYRQIFNGEINIRPERINLAQVIKGGMLHMRYTEVTPDMASVDTRGRTKKKTLTRIKVIKPKYKSEYSAESNNFIKLLHAVDGTDYEEQKLNLVDRYLVEAEGINTQQVKTLSESFLFDSSKMDLVETTKPYLLDKDNFKDLTSIFEDKSLQQEILDIAY